MEEGEGMRAKGPVLISKFLKRENIFCRLGSVDYVRTAWAMIERMSKERVVREDKGARGISRAHYRCELKVMDDDEEMRMYRARGRFFENGI